MPEIAEVARCVHFLRQHIVSKRVASVATSGDDPIIYLTAKTGLTAATISSKLKGRTVTAAKQQGKYFWLEFDKPPHLLCHFGMTGWVKFKGNENADYTQMKKNKKQQGEAEATDETAPSVMTSPEEWPPRFWKFILKMDDGAEAAFVDPRRLGRVRLIDVEASEMRNTTPLKENGPDPVIDKDTISKEWFFDLVQRKRVPIKSLLLDQAMFSGVGNWVADETLYHAKIHPEQYSDTLGEAEAERVREMLLYVCNTACELLADSSRFPDHWLMRHRWGKGRNGDTKTLPNGEKISFVTVGGRTSAFVAERQKKIRSSNDSEPKKAAAGAKRKSKKEEDEVEDGDEPEAKEAQKSKKTKTKAKAATKTEANGSTPSQTPQRRSTRASAVKQEEVAPEKEPSSTRKKKKN